MISTVADIERRAQVVDRPSVRGKSFRLGDEQLFLHGVTYGTFRPREDGSDYPDPGVVSRDFARMAENGINAVRLYTVPPAWVLDLAAEYRLHLMVGIPWEQHVTFLDERRRPRSIEARVREGVRACAGHPAILAYAVGNEIPAPIVRWHGPRRVERFLERLYEAAKAEDPDSLVTYVNYPTTEYLELPFLDFSCFNVYLEGQATLEAYLRRLHNLGGNRPLVMAEIGLDSRRHGEDAQAKTLRWQVRSAFESGCAGAFVFSWTDEWHRGGHDIDDWDFGLVDRRRQPKPALGSVREAFDKAPFDDDRPWPPISVVVCTYNGERWLRGCFDALRAVDYPAFEVIVVSDGSTDATADITREYGFRLIASENRGLSSARNLGLDAATGEIVAYLDDDARPEPEWLRHLALSFLRGTHAGVGGPNIPPAGDGTVAECVANAPGGPIHVLLSDGVAEHVPGCNMAFWKSELEAIGGFDERFRVAGDDVDICWRLQRQGRTIGFNPGAVVWHHRRGSVRAYLKQQYHYGKAEGLLERKWPERYNRVGHLSWAGEVYGGVAGRNRRRGRTKVRYGTWGRRLFQSVYQPATGTLGALPRMPEWYLLIAALAGLSALGPSWPPLLAALPVLAVAIGVLLFDSGREAAASTLRRRAIRAGEVGRWALTSVLHVLQPLARLAGRLRYGLAPWRRRSARVLAVPRSRTTAIWSEHAVPADQRLTSMEVQLRPDCQIVSRGGECDRWDLQVRGGPLGVARLRSVVEEHGGGRQLVRFRSWPKPSRGALPLICMFAALGSAAALDHAWVAAFWLAAVAVGVAAWATYDCSAAAGIVRRVVDLSPEPDLGEVRLAGGEAFSDTSPPPPEPERPAVRRFRRNPAVPEDGAAGSALGPPSDSGRPVTPEER